MIFPWLVAPDDIFNIAFGCVFSKFQQHNQISDMVINTSSLLSNKALNWHFEMTLKYLSFANASKVPILGDAVKIMYWE